MSADTVTAPPQLRPLALGEILDVSIKLFVRAFKTLVATVLIVGGTVAVLTVLVTLSVTGFGSSGASDAAAVGALVAILVLTVGLYVLVPVACFRALADAYLGRAPSWRSSLRFAVRRAG